MTRNPLRVTVLPAGLAAAAVLALLLGACGKKKLDKNVDRLVNAALKNDYEAFKEMAHSSLTEKYPPAKLEFLSLVLNKLGRYEDRSMRGIHVRSGGWRKGKYNLKFDKGSVRLEITLKDGKLVGFMFSGELMEKAAKEIRAGTYKEFKVTAFRFFGEDGKPKNNIYKAGQSIIAKISVSGLTRTPNGLHVRAAIRVLGPGDKVVLQNPDFLNKSLPIKPDEPPVATVTARLKLAQPGTYRLQFRILDVGSKRSLDHQQAVVMEPGQGAPAGGSAKKESPAGAGAE